MNRVFIPPSGSEPATGSAGRTRAYALDAASPPIFQTSSFFFDNFDDMADVYAGRSRRLIYSRGDNPTVMEFERVMAELDGAEAARAFSSGMGAIAATIIAFVSAGDRIVTVRNVYSDAYRLFELVLAKFGVTVDYLDGADAGAIAAALPGAKLLYLETPTSLTFELQDIATLAALARAQGVVSVIDNSWATPQFQKPIAHGVDLVIHAASKYLGGHSDTVAGVVSGSAEHVARINAGAYAYLGAKLSPFEAWLLLRGLATLELRLPRHMQSGLLIAGRLKAHPNVSLVRHPAYSDHPGKATLSGFSGLFSIEVGENIDVRTFANALKLFRLGVSWGGPESLVVPALAPLQLRTANCFARFGVSPRLIRLHVGLEDAEALWDDLERALALARS
ncbi:Cystathionine beta-lyase [Methylocella silvestris BL2]|uniref:Cystathionine beta-lyase n=1 Tax=Methylocella silvestris (strain DSM 15510 / CIP 108128 / LMG 27833 / NCIMB 13906 / BL2) TaxID=395965 RepID=B8EQL5_METSB|nr:PLP-dependent transferase [Methylocella silvestris]ACK52228.1 Cystathionine beta-lyase [Methylocella silvestris BL2]